jgi:hypothetical protein
MKNRLLRLQNTICHANLSDISLYRALLLQIFLQGDKRLFTCSGSIYAIHKHK